MKSIIVFISLFIPLSIVFAQPDTWMPIDSMNGSGKSVAASCVLNDNGYVIGGFTGTDFTRKMYSYDPIQNDWDDEVSVGGETGSGNNRGSAIAFAINNIAYYGLGQGSTANYYRDFWSFDPVTQTWTQQADFAGSARHGAVAFANNEVGFVGTGQDANGLCKDFFKYIPSSNTWEQIADFGGTARKFAVGHMIGTEGYVMMGDDGVYKNDSWVYVSQFDVWAPLTGLPGAGRSGVASWVDYPSIFIACGEKADGTVTNEVWEYNIFGEDWVQRASVPGPMRKHPVAFSINGMGYLGAGYAPGGQFLDDFYSYQRVLTTQNQEQLTVSLFPNPSSDFVMVDQETIEEATAINELGQAISLQISNNQLDIRGLASGTYLIHLKSINGQNFVARVIKK